MATQKEELYVDVTMSYTDIKKIFARVEGDLIHNHSFFVIYSTRVMLVELFKQLPQKLRDEIETNYPRTIKAIRV